AELAYLYYDRGAFKESRAAAMQAYKSDAYLSYSEPTIYYLFETAFETGDENDAQHWCGEVAKHHTAEPWLATTCKLKLLAWAQTGGASPDSAWRLLPNTSPPTSPQLRSIF